MPDILYAGIPVSAYPAAVVGTRAGTGEPALKARKRTFQMLVSDGADQGVQNAREKKQNSAVEAAHYPSADIALHQLVMPDSWLLVWARRRATIPVGGSLLVLPEREQIGRAHV